MNVAIVTAGMTAGAQASALEADYVLAEEDAQIEIVAHPRLLAAVAWRIGMRAFRLQLLAGPVITSTDFLAWGVVDALVPRGADSVKWVADWIGGRSELALDSAAALIRRRGGDSLERVEFARIFAIGEPQIGMAAFLAKRRPQWTR
jgi:enoyl-CoA hydratase/carnithine racemase